MTKTFLLALSLLVSAAWVQAQSQYPQTQNPQTGSSQAGATASGQTTVKRLFAGLRWELHVNGGQRYDVSASG